MRQCVITVMTLTILHGIIIQLTELLRLTVEFRKNISKSQLQLLEMRWIRHNGINNRCRRHHHTVNKRRSLTHIQSFRHRDRVAEQKCNTIDKDRTDRHMQTIESGQKYLVCAIWLNSNRKIHVNLSDKKLHRFQHRCTLRRSVTSTLTKTA